MSIERFFISDYFWVPVLEFILFNVFITAVIDDRAAKSREGGTGGKVTRGETSWTNLFWFWAIAIVFLQIVLSSDILGVYRVLVGLLDALMLFYLTIISFSFKNRIIGWAIKIKNKAQQI